MKQVYEVYKACRNAVLGCTPYVIRGVQGVRQDYPVVFVFQDGYALCCKGMP